MWLRVLVPAFPWKGRWFQCAGCDRMVTGLASRPVIRRKAWCCCLGVRCGQDTHIQAWPSVHVLLQSCRLGLQCWISALPAPHHFYSYTHCCKECEEGPRDCKTCRCAASKGSWKKVHPGEAMPKTNGAVPVCPAPFFDACLDLHGQGAGTALGKACELLDVASHQVQFREHRQHYLLHDPGGDGPLPVLLFLSLGSRLQPGLCFLGPFMRQAWGPHLHLPGASPEPRDSSPNPSWLQACCRRRCGGTFGTSWRTTR